MNDTRLLSIFTLILTLLTVSHSAHADDSKYTAHPELGRANLLCSAKWDELCEDKKIIAAPSGYQLCRNEVSTLFNKGKTEVHTVEVTDKHVTVYFKAEGNNDRFKKQGADIQLTVTLYGTRSDTPCQ